MTMHKHILRLISTPSFLLAGIISLLLFACGSRPEPATAVSKPSTVKAGDTFPENLGPDGVVDIATVDAPLRQRGLAEATFAGGCFWCTEAIFERVKGVEAVYSGYAGGSVENPSYELVCTGTTDHAEAVQVYYDSTVIDYHTLLDVFFAAHDPTQLNRQGPDVGTQYRSAIFYHNEQQRQIAGAFLDSVRTSGVFARPVVTELGPLNAFYKAEAYHQNYLEHHYNDGGYISSITRPKVEKFVHNHPGWLKESAH